MGIKTFPLVLTEEEHARIQKEARKRGESIKEFITKAIDKRIEEELDVTKV